MFACPRSHDTPSWRTISPNSPHPPMKTIMPVLACLLALWSPRAAGQTSLSLNLGAAGETVRDQMTFSNGGLTATATAWSLSRLSGDAVFERSEVVQWSPGLGVKNPYEFITDTPYVPFYVDNRDHYDFILFVFSESVEIKSVSVSPSAGTFDLDVSFWMGNVSGTPDLAGDSFADLAGLGFGARIDNDWYSSNASRTIGITSPDGGVNALLFGARVNGDSTFDRFKISTIGVTTIPQSPENIGLVPEPGSAALLAFGAACLGFRRRR